MASSPQPLADGLLFGESPRYRDGALYVSDMIGRKIYRIDAASGAKTVLAEVEQQPNGMAFHPDDGSLIYSSMFDGRLYRRRLDKDDGETTTLYADLSGVMTGYCGDMVIDASGRVFVDDTGARVLHGEKPRPGRLLTVAPGGGSDAVSVAADDIVFANGVVISNDGRHLFVAETFRYGLLRFDLAPDGQLTGRRDYWSPTALLRPTIDAVDPADLAANMIGIDGACMDAAGGLWLSMLGYEQFVRLETAPAGDTAAADHPGRVTHRIPVDGHATACTLGGPDGKTLFLVVNKVPAGENLFEAMVAKRTACSVLSVRVDVGRGSALP